MLGDLIVWWALSSLILITMNSGRGHCAWWQFCKVLNQTHREIEKMYAIKQIKICAEYRDMLPRPRLDLSGTPGLRPIGLSPGSWQTSLGLGSMSRYSAQILICIISYAEISSSKVEISRIGFKSNEDELSFSYQVSKLGGRFKNTFHRWLHVCSQTDWFIQNQVKYHCAVRHHDEPCGPFYWQGLTLIPAWISDYIHYKMWDDITYPFPPLKFMTG